MFDDRRSERTRTAHQQRQNVFTRRVFFLDIQVNDLSALGRIHVRNAIQNRVDVALIHHVFFRTGLLGYLDTIFRKKRLRFGTGLSAGTMVVPIHCLRHVLESPHETRNPLVEKP